MIKEKFKVELIKYVLIGAFVVLIDFLLYHFFYKVFQINFSNSKRLSYVSGTIVSFFLNKYITFDSPKKNLNEAFLFGTLYFVSFSFNSLSHDFLLNYFSGNYPFYIATIVSIIINYLGQKFIVFKKK